MEYSEYIKCVFAVENGDKNIFVAKNYSERVCKIINAVASGDVRELINNSKFKTVTAFRREYKISGKTLYRWINGETEPPSYILQSIGLCEINKSC